MIRSAVQSGIKVVAVALFSTVSIWGQSKKEFPVGLETRSYVDENRRNYSNTGPRPLDTVIWFPAEMGTKTEVPALPGGTPKDTFVLQPLAKDAPLASGTKKYPLIVLSHGTSSFVYSLGWFAWYLASHGYIVAGVNHHGNTSAEPQMMAQGFMLQWDRPKDLTALVDKLLADPKFGPHIDATRIGAAGHSAGGATVIEFGGGQFDSAALTAFCTDHAKDPGCDVPDVFKKWIADYNKIKDTDPVILEAMKHEHDRHSDARVKAVFSMAPAVGHAFTAESLHATHVPVTVVTGTGDEIVSPANNAEWYAYNIPGAKLKEFPDASHFVFGTECTANGQATIFICKEKPGVDRGQVHTQTEQLALEFFNKSLHVK